MKITFSGIDAAMTNLDSGLIRASSKLTKKRASIILNELVAATPIDTGLARSSWTSTPGIGGAVVLQNSVEYIESLNKGSSKQAPAHFVERVALRHGTPQGALVSYE